MISAQRETRQAGRCILSNVLAEIYYRGSIFGAVPKLLRYVYFAYFSLPGWSLAQQLHLTTRSQIQMHPEHTVPFRSTPTTILRPGEYFSDIRTLGATGAFSIGLPRWRQTPNTLPLGQESIAYLILFCVKAKCGEKRLLNIDERKELEQNAVLPRI